MKINGMSISQFIKNQVDNGCEIIENASNMTMTDGEIVARGQVVVRKGDKRIVLKGDKIVKKNNVWYVDGKEVDMWDIEIKDTDMVSIEIKGDVGILSLTTGDVTVNGSCMTVKTGSGDVKCESVLSVSTGSGDVTCNKIAGSVSTGSGDMYRK
jgi:lipopolysaccharide assembly outer membrane protein LptD (OstA)